MRVLEPNYLNFCSHFGMNVVDSHKDNCYDPVNASSGMITFSFRVDVISVVVVMVS